MHPQTAHRSGQAATPLGRTVLHRKETQRCHPSASKLAIGLVFSRCCPQPRPWPRNHSGGGFFHRIAVCFHRRQKSSATPSSTPVVARRHRWRYASVLRRRRCGTPRHRQCFVITPAESKPVNRVSTGDRSEIRLRRHRVFARGRSARSNRTTRLLAQAAQVPQDGQLVNLHRWSVDQPPDQKSSATANNHGARSDDLNVVAG